MPTAVKTCSAVLAPWPHGRIVLQGTDAGRSHTQQYHTHTATHSHMHGLRCKLSHDLYTCPQQSRHAQLRFHPGHMDEKCTKVQMLADRTRSKWYHTHTATHSHMHGLRRKLSHVGVFSHVRRRACKHGCKRLHRCEWLHRCFSKRRMAVLASAVPDAAG